MGESAMIGRTFRFDVYIIVLNCFIIDVIISFDCWCGLESTPRGVRSTKTKTYHMRLSNILGMLPWYYFIKSG